MNKPSHGRLAKHQPLSVQACEFYGRAIQGSLPRDACVTQGAGARLGRAPSSLSRVRGVADDPARRRSAAIPATG